MESDDEFEPPTLMKRQRSPATAEWRRKQRAQRERCRRVLETAAERGSRLEKGRERARLRREKQKKEAEEGFPGRLRTWRETQGDPNCKIEERARAEKQRVEVMDKEGVEGAEKQSVQVVDLDGDVENRQSQQVSATYWPALNIHCPRVDFSIKNLLHSDSPPLLENISDAEREAASLAVEIAEADNQIRWTSEVIFSAVQHLVQLYAKERPFELAASSARVLQERARARRLTCVSRRSQLLPSLRPPTVSPDSFLPGPFPNPATEICPLTRLLSTMDPITPSSDFSVHSLSSSPNEGSC